MNDMKEQIKIALLAVIAGALIIQVMSSDGGDEVTDDYDATTPGLEAIGTPNNNVAAQTVTPLSDNPLASQLTSVDKPKGPLTSIKFNKDAFDFGNIKQNSTDNKHTFTFTNTGDKPLIIANAKGSCGCTVPVWPKEPIPPGETGEIDVDYKPGKQKGTQRKTVTITANTDPADTRITISADVEEIPE